MATRAEIESDIDSTRSHITDTIEELSDIIHKKTDIKKQVSKQIYRNPMGGVAVAALFGFTLATISSPIGKNIFKFLIKSAVAASYGYVTKKGIDIIADKIKT
jgi:hypothetical protein